MNCKEEFLDHTREMEVLCAEIAYGRKYWLDHGKASAALRVGHTKIELDTFLSCIDFDYDNGYGVQEVFGTIWYADGTWSDRGEYDGSEWWDYHVCPKIPDELSAAEIGRTMTTESVR